MQVTLIASTQTHDEAMFGDPSSAAADWDPTGRIEDAELLVEFAGRACYQSWSNPSGRDNAEYIGNIIGQGHFSVLEHASASFYIEGVSRSLTHEIVRHRHFSFSQQSQRFVNLANAKYVVPPALAELLGEPSGVMSLPTVQQELDMLMRQTLITYERLADFLQRKNLTRKQAREAARAVLPNMVETSIVVTGNHRTWREFIQKRFTPYADAEIRELAGLLLTELRAVAPAIYQDIPEEPAG